MIEIELLNGACCLQSLDDSRMCKELGIEIVRSTRRGMVFRMTVERARFLLAEFQTNHGSGWAHENPGAAKRAAQGAQRRLQAAIEKEIGS
jgi:hypothetical protein